MRAGMTEWSSQCRSGNVKISSSSCAPHQFHSEFVTRNWFRWQALQTKSGRRYPKITFYPVKANFLNNSRGGGWREGGGGERGRETARTQSATDRKIKEHDKVGSRCRFVRYDTIEWEKEKKNGLAGKRKVWEVTRASRVSSFVGIAKFSAGQNSSEAICSGYARGKNIYIYLKKLHLFILPSSVQDYPPFITADQREGGRSSCFLLTYLPRRIAMNITTCNKKNARGIITKRNVNREPRIRDLGTKRRERLIRRLF